MFPSTLQLPRLGRVHRLGLATRGNTSLHADDVFRALDWGVNYLNWCGHDDGMREAIAQLGPRRSDIRIAVQLSARSADSARRELDDKLTALAVDSIDVVTYYYVESQEEWAEIIAPGGAAEALEAARQQGVIRSIGLTSHQRGLAAAWAESGRLDLLMIRYNAAHRGAERDVFPVTERLGMPVAAFTCLRWGKLLEPTPNDPAGFELPPAADWYRYALMHPAVSVALMAPNGSEELDENLNRLSNWRELSAEEFKSLSEHGQRVRECAAYFP